MPGFFLESLKMSKRVPNGVALKSGRFVIPIALSLAIFELFAINACAIIDGGSGLSVDQLIDASRGVYIPKTGMPENPAAARKLWSEESAINFTMPDKLSGNSTNLQASRSYVQTGEALVYQTAGNVSLGQAKAASSPEPVISPPSLSIPSPDVSPDVSTAEPLAASVKGDWSFRLKDSKNSVLVLTLFQSGDTVYAAGTLNDGGDTLKVLASGFVTGDKMSLDVISSGDIRLYRLRLDLSGNSASGEYRAFSTNRDPWIGIVEGVLAAK